MDRTQRPTYSVGDGSYRGVVSLSWLLILMEMCSRSLTFSIPHKHPMNSLSGPGQASTAPRPETLSKRLSRALSVGRHLLIGPIHPRPQVSDAPISKSHCKFQNAYSAESGTGICGLSPTEWEHDPSGARQDGEPLSGKGKYVNLSASTTMREIERGNIHPALPLTIGSSEREAMIRQVAAEKAARGISRQQMIAARHNQQMASLNNATVQTPTLATQNPYPHQGSAYDDSKPPTVQGYSVQGYQPSSWGSTGHPAVTCHCPVGFCTHLYSPGGGAW